MTTKLYFGVQNPLLQQVLRDVQTMTENVDANSLPNDKFGFRIYGVMVHLPEPQASRSDNFTS